MQKEEWETTNAGTLALICGIILLISFIFLPWYGNLLMDNGARVFSDNLYGAPGAKPAPYIGLITLAALGGVIFPLLGLLSPDHSFLAMLGWVISGLVGLAYYVLAWTVPIPTNLPLVFGSGYWLCLISSVGLVVSPVLATPWVKDFLESRQKVSSKRGLHIPRDAVPYMFLFAPLVLYFIWIIAPTFYTIYLSLTNWDGVSSPGWVGFTNFERLFTRDRTFVEALINNLRWLVVFITVPTTVGLGLAMVFNQEMFGSRAYKVSFYSPLVLSLAVIGLIWAWLYNPQFGLINQFLVMLGVADPPGWLGERGLAIWAVIFAAVWRQVGYVMVLYLAGLKNIDPTFIDAGLVDGANRWQLFRNVIFPLLAPVTTIIVVISIIDSLRAFDLVSIMTRGGQSTQVLANFMYIEAFNNYRMGYGAAIAVVLFFISLVFILFYLSRVIKDELEY
jgi:multiple sugar transport system permease protein